MEYRGLLSFEGIVSKWMLVAGNIHDTIIICLWWCRSAFTRALKQGIRDTYAPVDVIDFGLFLFVIA